MEGTAGGALAAVLLFLLFQLCGTCAAWYALPGERVCVKLWLGSVCGTVMLQWFPVPFAFFWGFSMAAHLGAVLLALCCAGACLALSRKRRGTRKTCAGQGSWKFLAVVFATFLFFCFLVWHSFSFEDGKIFSSQATYGDMSMHLSFITSLAKQGKFPPNYSLLPGSRLSYPFLSDSISSSLYLFGAPLRLAYALPMFLAGAQVFLGFYLFAARLLKDAKKAGLAWILFFFNGGLGIFYFLGGGWENFTRIFTAFYQTPTNLIGENVRWVNVVVDMMLPQRATLFGWSVLFPALYLLYRAVFEGRRRYFLLTGILAGLLPMIHTHSFLALALVCGAWLVFSLLRGLHAEKTGVRACKILTLIGLPGMTLLQMVLRNAGALDSPGLLWVACAVLGACVLLTLFLAVQYVKTGRGKRLCSTWGVLLGVVCVLALPQLCFWTFRQAAGGSFLRGHFGWVVGGDGYLWFYLKNGGLCFLLALMGLLTADTRQFIKLSPVLPIWFLGEFVEFQPNDYDNNKLFYVAFVFLCCAASSCACRWLKMLKSRGLRASVGAAGLFLCTISALLTMGREAVSRYQLFGEGALALCAYVEENLPSEAVVLTDTRHNNEIASLTGRNVVCGSPAYLYYHGLPYQGREAAARQMYETPKEGEELFRRFEVDYVLVSDFERSSYQVNETELDQLFPRVYDDGNRVLYQVEERRDRR